MWTVLTVTNCDQVSRDCDVEVELEEGLSTSTSVDKIERDDVETQFSSEREEKEADKKCFQQCWAKKWTWVEDTDSPQSTS